MPLSENKAQPAISATTQVLTGAGVLRRIVVQATGTGLVDVYDNTATSGTPIFSMPASVAVGTVYQLDIPMGVGIRIVVAASGPQITVVYGGG